MHEKLETFWDDHGERFAELVAVGGWEPTGYGIITRNNDHLYNRVGLDRDEFMELKQLKWYLFGMCEILGVRAWEWIGDRLEEEWEHREMLSETE